ncbi:MarR family winged helix-turn-helix transcriptional regulator [Ferviditalea candida]|uniref:MarR family transcriptional regulator n=1 Tax=Ferviditalea candida TaxID=3108399 RepID=A0ABU5ZGJ2_9BACL|nr:MarR family transcriptional regulator [Paenibacillaceae bacterium T2]
MVAERIHQELTPEQHYGLDYIQANGPCPSSALSDRFGVNRSAVTALVDRLVSKGFVRRIPDSVDRRVVLLYMTDKGVAALKAGKESIRKFVGVCMEELEEAEIEQFIRVYEKMSDILQRKNTTGSS